MTEPYAWYYLPGTLKQHVVRQIEFKNFPCQTAICGRQVLAALPAAVRWQRDAQGLESREKCRSCLAQLNRILKDRSLKT